MSLVEEVTAEDVARLLAPIDAQNPAGLFDVENETYQAIDQEMVKLGGLQEPSIDWAYIEEASRQYLGLFGLSLAYSALFAPFLYYFFEVEPDGTTSVWAAALITAVGFAGLHHSVGLVNLVEREDARRLGIELALSHLLRDVL